MCLGNVFFFFYSSFSFSLLNITLLLFCVFLLSLSRFQFQTYRLLFLIFNLFKLQLHYVFPFPSHVYLDCLMYHVPYVSIKEVIVRLLCLDSIKIFQIKYQIRLFAKPKSKHVQTGSCYTYTSSCVNINSKS